MTAPDAATEIVADVAEEVADQATHIAEVSRGLSGRNFGLVFGGFIVGAGLGGIAGYIFAQRQLETKYSEIAAEEIAEMREHYNEKATALEAQSSKGDLAKIVRDRGYSSEPDEEESTAPPMAVTPPAAVIEQAEEAQEEDGVEEPPSPEEDPEPEVRNIFADNPPPDDVWDAHKERAQRSPMRPYVIHRDEREVRDEAYDPVTYTYYEADDVVCNERDDVIGPEDRERIIGETNLEKFGHGSGDSTTVYIRNDQLEMDIEVIKSPNSFAQEVHGFEPEIKHSHHRRERTRIEDE